ncbi:hypothetical protein CEXT_330051 [Caerostris extrusa]|uniref:Uncharacterized protein n=1 Tax=Caerostris extrusa TaxID=172846 RepID=A0AAV4MI12_CAEEX|nr:hypothetical protein CEXT_330051 [Caerostris extrusa]
MCVWLSTQKEVSLRGSVSHWERDINFRIHPLFPGRSIAFFPLPKLISSERVFDIRTCFVHSLQRTVMEHFRSLSGEFRDRRRN